MYLILNEINEWFFSFLAIIPGNLGRLVRRFFYTFLLEEASKINIEKGCKIIACHNIKCAKGVNIGMNSFITSTESRLIIGENTVIGMNAHINADKGEYIEIGSNCIIGPNLLIRAANHKYNNPKKLIRDQGHSPGKIVIEDNVWIGANVTILGNTYIKSGSVIAAGSIISKKYKEKALIAGNPGKVIKKIG